MLRHFITVDLSEVKAKIIADQDFREHLRVNDDKEYESIVSALVDFVEFLTLSNPMDRVFDHLPDRASHQIVGNSVAKVTTDDQIEDLVRLVWLTNINASQGKYDLIKAIQALPKVHFLRGTLTSILMLRVKWKVSDHDTRMALLDAADAAIKPYNPHLDKGEIMRFVEKHIPDNDAVDEGIEQ
jgi:hypothetical protein